MAALRVLIVGLSILLGMAAVSQSAGRTVVDSDMAMVIWNFSIVAFLVYLAYDRYRRAR